MVKKALKKQTKHSSRDANLWAMLCHLSSLLGFLCGGFGLIAPLVIWFIKRHLSPLIMENGKSIINFVLSCYLYVLIFLIVLVLMALMSLWSITFLLSTAFLIAIPLSVLGIASIIQLIFIIIGSIEAWQGKVYHYPLTIRFLK